MLTYTIYNIDICTVYRAVIILGKNIIIAD